MYHHSRGLEVMREREVDVREGCPCWSAAVYDVRGARGHTHPEKLHIQFGEHGRPSLRAVTHAPTGGLPELE